MHHFDMLDDKPLRFFIDLCIRPQTRYSMTHKSQFHHPHIGRR